jgi:peroxiredoxin family protein
MPVLLDNRFLNSARLQTIIETRASDLERMRPLTFLDRLTLVNAEDDDITGRFTARQVMADLIGDDQEAVVGEGGRVELVVTALANIKRGQNVSQSQLNAMERLRRGQARAAEEDALFDWEQRFVEWLLQAVRERMNQVACAMMLDTLSYDRMGLKFAGVTWGMPANLKVTVSPLWSLDAGANPTTANAKPIRDILNMDKVDADNYGAGPFDRITMSTQAFDLMTQTDDFRNRASLYVDAGFALSAGMLAVEDRDMMKNLMGRILGGKEIVIDDKTSREEINAGTTTSARVLPANKVILDRKSNGAREWDWGNGVVTESIVAGLIGDVTLGENPRMAEGGAYGPLAYYTAQNPSLNPPGVNGWAVVRGFPRKHDVECQAVLTVF